MEEARLLFRKIVKILSADEFLIKEIRYFVESLGILLNNVIPLIEKYERGHSSPDALMEFILSQWISIEGNKATLAELTRILLEMENKACAENLQELQKNHSGPIKLPNKRKHSSSRENDSKSSGAQAAHCSRYPPPEETRPIIFGIRNVVLNFIGRDTELKKLQEYFHSEEPFVVISGLGGIGKTELTKKFALTATLPDTEKSIAKSWLSGESPQSLLQSITKFCLHLNLTATDSHGKPLGLKEMLEKIMTKLKSSAGFEKWLVVIDNVDGTHEEFKIAVKTLHGFGPDVLLLVTSRRTDIYSRESEFLEVTGLKLEDSMEFVRKSLKINDKSADIAIKSLCHQLDNFPLALSQAVAYIKQQKRQTLIGNVYGVQNYLDELSKTETLGLDKELELADYTNATLKVWHITLDKIKECHEADGAMALNLLDVMAFINPDEIQINFLCKLYPQFYATQEIDMNRIPCCLSILFQYSLISSCNSVISVHRLVQLAVRVRMATTTDQNPNRRDIEMLKTFWTSFDFEVEDRNEMANVLKIWIHFSSHPELDSIRANTSRTVLYKPYTSGAVYEILDDASKGCKFRLNAYSPESYLDIVLRLAIAMEGKSPKSSYEKITFVYEKFKERYGEAAAYTWIAKQHPGFIKPPNQQGKSGDNDPEPIGMISAQEAHCSRNPPPAIIFSFRDVLLNFIGREEELKKLNEYFQSGEPFVVISGLRGIGKTELAKKFAQMATLHDTANSIAISWLSGESPQSLMNSTAEFCHHLYLTVRKRAGIPLGIEKLLEKIMAKLKYSAGFKKWLVVIDNVDETHEEFKIAVKTLHEFGPDVFLLVTSRRMNICTGEPKHVELTQLTTLKLEDSMEYIKKSLKITDNSADEAINSLCHQLDNFFLALSQAVAYIKQQQRLTLAGMAYGVQDYLDELSKTETLGLCKDFELAEYPKATLKVCHITLDKIKECHGADGAMALDLLDVMAFINPDNIHRKFLCKLFPLFYTIEEINLNQIDSCITILLQYSLISSYNSVISIHRAVQLAIRTRMATTDQNNPHRRDVEILTTFWSSFKSKEFYPNEMRNILNIWNHSSTHPELDVIRSSRVKVVFDELRRMVMWRSEALEVIASEGCALMLKLYGAENKEYFQMVLRLGIALRLKGEYEASVEKLTFAYDKLKELYGEDDPDTLEAVGWIANVLRRLKKYEQSLEWRQKILQSKIRIYGNNHQSTIETKRDLAYTLGSLGRKEEEMEMRNEILEWEEVHFGKDHPSTIEARRQISTYFLKMGKYPEAHDVFQKMLSIEEERFGVDDPQTLNTKKSLANTLEKMGKLEEALKIYEEVLIADKKAKESKYSQYYLWKRVKHLKDLIKIKNEERSITDNE